MPLPQDAQFGIAGVQIKDRFWYWKDAVTLDTITSRSAKDRARRWVNGLVAAGMVASIGVFGWNVVLYDAGRLYKRAFWTTPNATSFAFFLAILCGCILFSRVRSYANRVHSLPVRISDESVEDVTLLPSLDLAKHPENIAQVCTPEAYKTVESAFELAQNGHHAEVGAAHLFVAAIGTQSVGILFLRLGLSFDQLKDPLRRHLLGAPEGEAELGVVAQKLIAEAVVVARRFRRTQVTPLEFFVACYEQESFLQELLFSVGVEKEMFEQAIAWVRVNEELSERYTSFSRAAALKPSGNMDRAYTAVATPFLDQSSEDLTAMAASGHVSLLVGREAEMRQMLRAMESGSRSIVLVGEPGVGKAALIEGLAERMVREEVPKILQDKRLLRLSVPHLVAENAGVGAQERLLYALREVGQSGNIILVIENIHELIEGSDLASVLASELEKRYTIVVATTTPSAYSQSVERSVLGQKLEKIVVEESGRSASILVLESKVGSLENRYGIVFTYESLAALVDFSSRYMHDAYLPEKAIKLADEVALTVSQRGEKWARVSKEDVAAIVSEKTRIPVTQVTQAEGEKLLDLESRMHERMIGQEEAVKAIASALRRARAELRAQNRPIANFLFLGSTGVGKTELAKTTAEVYFGSEQAMIRFDMSEYQDKASIYRLIGSGGEGGLLTEAVRQNPFSLVLLDELEKAHPDILNLFLQVMDDGRLTDSAGRTIDFTNVILIATSNAGTQYIQEEVAKGTSLDVIREGLLEEQLKGIYRPEFLNRFDGVIVFKPLSEEDVVAIAYLMIKKVADQLTAKGIHFRPTDEAVYELAKKGYDPKFGARPLRRVIQEHVENAVADFLLRGQVNRRDTLVLSAGGEITVEKAAELS